MGILTRLWEGIRRGIGLLLPFFAQAIDFRGVARHLIAVLRFVLLIVVLVVLYFINVYTLSKNKLLENTPFAFLQDFWLPILFLLLVAISWLVWWIYKTVTEPEVSRFPDIDRD